MGVERGACIMHKTMLLVVAVALLWPATSRAEGADYLIICPDSYVDAIAPLAEWKSRKGLKTHVTPLSDIGYSSFEIMVYVADVAEDWDPIPQFILLVGDSTVVPYSTSTGDTGYGCIDNDGFIEIHPGRFPATNIADVETMVAKTLMYERTPTTDEAYYGSASMLVAPDYDDDDWVHYYSDADWTSGLMTGAGFDNVRVISEEIDGNPGAAFVNMLEGGIAYGAFHGQIGGWYTYNGDPNTVSNGPMLPVMAIYTCGGGSYGSSWLQAGTADDPRGAVAYVGQLTSCSGCAHWRSALRRGLWGYIFEDTAETEIVTMGEAAEAARLNYYEEILATGEYTSSALFGDPELNLWTAPPRDIAVSHPPTICRGEVDVTIGVALDGGAREGARVGLMSDEGTVEGALTGADGQATLTVDTSADTTLYVTVTGRNLRPYEGELVVVGEPVETGDDDDTIGDDDTADDDDFGSGDDDSDGIVTEPIETDDPNACQCRHGRRAGAPVALLLLLGIAAVRRRGGAIR
jgi:gingipain R